MKDFGAECRDVRFREVGVCCFTTVLDLSSDSTKAVLDPRDPSQSTTGVGGVTSTGLHRQRWLGDFPVVRGPREGHSDWALETEEVFGGGYIPTRAGPD